MKKEKGALPTKKTSWTFEPIGVARTCFKEKFGIPRQPGLVAGATGTLKLFTHHSGEELKGALKALEGFSHLWVIFVFHEHDAKKWKPGIRPPRLGGNRKVGVLASRSPHRPNPIGLSVVKIEAVRPDAKGGPEIEVSGVDLLDGTPLLDIKPYIEYADSLKDTKSGWAAEEIQRAPVEFTEAAQARLTELEDQSTSGKYVGLRALVIEMLEMDPRPAFQKRRMPMGSPQAEGTRYGFALLDLDVQWEIQGGKIKVLNLPRLNPAAPVKATRKP